MKYGSLFYNFWAALISFTVYFIWLIRNPVAIPIEVIGKAFVAAILGFVIMFFVRSFMGFVFYTPETILFSEDENASVSSGTNLNTNQQFVPQNNRSTVEFEEENPEELAQVVRTMLHEQDQADSK